MTTRSQPDIPPMEKAISPAAEAWSMFKQNHAAMLGLILLIIITFGAIVGPLLHPTDPFEMVWAPFSPPEKRAFIWDGLSRA